MGDKFYAVVNENGDVLNGMVDDDLCIATIFTRESDAHECLIRFGNKNYRVIEVTVLQEKEPKND